MKQQHTLMKFDPATGEPKPYPSHAEQWREWHGRATAWLFNPWAGTRRDAGDVGSDTFGLLIVPHGEPINSCGCMAESRAELLAEDIECLHMALDKAGVPKAREIALTLAMCNGNCIEGVEMTTQADINLVIDQLIWVGTGRCKDSDGPISAAVAALETLGNQVAKQAAVIEKLEYELASYKLVSTPLSITTVEKLRDIRDIPDEHLFE